MDQIKLTELDPALQLNTITSATAGGTVAGNISTLTHLAAELISKKALFSPEELAKSKSMVMNSFGLEGDMDQLVATPMDDTAAVAAVTDAKQLKYALINAAIANALLNSTAKAGEVATLSSRLNAAATDFANNDGALRVQRDDDAGFELALDEVLQAASQTSQQVQQRLEDANIDNANLVDDLANLATGFGHELDVRKENAGDDGRVVVVPTQPTNGDAMAKAVAMVKDVRVFANLIEGKGRNGEDFYGKVNDFDQLSIAATEMVEQEADKFVLLAELAEIAAEINAGLKSGQLTGTTFDLADYNQALAGSVIYDPTNYHFKVVASSSTEKVNLELKITGSEDMKTYKLSLQGELSSASARLELANDSMIELQLSQPYDLDTAAFGVEPQPVKGKLILDAKLSQLASATVANPMTFHGKIEAALNDWPVTDIQDQGTPGLQDGYEFYGDTLLLPAKLSLIGALSNSQQDEVSVIFSADIARPTSSTEAETSFMQADAALTVRAKIAGYDLSVKLDARRTALEQAKLALTISYKLPDNSAQRSFTVTGDTSSDWVEMTNDQGVTVSLDRSIKSGNSQVTLGEIKVGGVKMADIINRSGVVLIKYSNNNIESL